MSDEQNSQFNEKGLIMVTTLLSIVFSFIPSLIYWLLQKEKMEDGYKAFLVNLLNFEITIFIFSTIFAFVLPLLAWLVSLVNLVVIIIATIKVSKNEPYKFPLTIELIK